MLKAIKMTLIRPHMTDFQMNAGDDCVLACSPLPKPMKESSCPLIISGGSAFGHQTTAVCLRSRLSFPATLPLYWLLSGEQPDPIFSNINDVSGPASWLGGKDPPANAGDTGSIPDLGRSSLLRCGPTKSACHSSGACALEPVSPS